MSVIVRNNPSVGVGGSTSKGFPPGDILNIQHGVNDGEVLIKWTDPEDTIVDNVVFVKWKGTILVRNSDHYPTSIKDGDVVVDNIEKNKYKDIFYIDSNLTNDHIYYYRFFTYSEDKVYNDSNNMIFKEKPISYDPILKNNTWSQIANVIESDRIPDTWKIGDEIDLVLSGTFNETVTLQIWDFNHFDKSDGSGKARILFGMKHLMKTEQKMNIGISNGSGWNNSYMKNTVMTNVFNSMPTELRNVIKEVNTYANKGGASGNPGQGLLSIDKVFLPGLTECDDNSWSSQNQTETGQKKFPIFSNDASRIKKLSNGTGVAQYWWTRSPYYSFTSDFCNLSTNGSCGSYLANFNYGVCFCFNV